MTTLKIILYSTTISITFIFAFCVYLESITQDHREVGALSDVANARPIQVGKQIFRCKESK